MAASVMKYMSDYKLKSYFKHLHDTYYGAQDEYLKEDRRTRLKQPRYTDIIETRTIVANPSSKGSVRINIKDKEGGIANIIIKSDKWESAEFEIGGQRMIKIYNIMDVNTFSITDNGFCVPFIEYHDMAICIHGVDDSITVEYDIVKSDSNKNGVYEFLFTSLVEDYLNYSVVVQPTFQEVKVGFHHPVSKVFAKFEKNVEKVYMKFNDDSENQVPFKKVSDTEYVLDFGETTINFSRIDKAELVILNSEPDNSVFCYAETYHVMRGMSGMYGLAFSK